MTFSDFVTLTNQNPRAVLLLEGTREPLPVHASSLTALATGQTVQAIMRDTSASNNITLSKLNLIAIAA